MLTIYKASAGSGKTYTLALEYIKLLLGVRNPGGRQGYRLNHRAHLDGRQPEKRHHSRILAVTFTNKATAEMKERIIKELFDLTKLPAPCQKDAEYAARLMEEFGCSRQELAESASAAFRQLMDDYGRFNVSTIDAFFQTVLRSFAREIERQGDYRLELSEDAVIGQAMSLLFDELNLNHATPSMAGVTDWINKMTSARKDRGQDFNPFNRRSQMYKDIVKAVESTFKEEFVEKTSRVEEYLSDPSRLKRFDEWLDDQINSMRISISDKAKALIDSLGNEMQANPRKFFSGLITATDKNGKALAENAEAFNEAISKSKIAAYISNLMDGNGESCFLAKDKNKAAHGLQAAAAFAKMRPLSQRCMVLKTLRESTLSLWVLNYIHKFIDQYRRDNNLILLSDTNSLLGSIINESDTPFIYEKVGVELENFLIDEFQDTSRLQWRNFRPLLANSLAEDHDSLIIGDVKQAIYRFRGGDRALLDTHVQDRDFPAPLHRVKGGNPGENTNYRSSGMLVKFNNTLFRDISRKYGISGYEGVAQTSPESKAAVPGYLRILDFSTDESIRAISGQFDETDCTEKGTPLLSLEPHQLSMAIMARRILAQHESGYPFSEIAVLCRRGNEAVEIAEFLRSEYPSVKLVSEEGLLLSKSLSVKMIVSMLEIIDKSLFSDPATPRQLHIDDPIEQLRLRNIERRRRRDVLTDYFNLNLAAGMELQDALASALRATERDESSDDLKSDLELLRSKAPSNLTALIEAIVDVKIPAEQRNKEIAYISAFIDLASEFTQNFTPSVHSFLNYWNEVSGKAAVGASSDVDAVTIMTIHKAKGLQWACVHVPFVAWSIEPKDENMWLDLDCDPSLPRDITPPALYVKPILAMTAHGSPYAPQVDYVVKEGQADNLNVAYVAFTRPERELDLHLFPKGKSDKGEGLNDILKQALSVSSPATEIYTDFATLRHTDGIIHAGEPTTPSKPRKADDIETAQTTLDPVKADKGSADSLRLDPCFPVSFNPLNARFARLEDLATLTEPADDPDIGNEADRDIVDAPATAKETVNSLAMEQAARKGIIMHSILSQMYDINDLDGAIDRHRRNISTDEAVIFREEIARAFDLAGPQARAWFEPNALEVITEQPIFNAATNESSRVDRIVVNPDDSIDVVDYKFTSQPKPSHGEQVNGYVDLLKGIYPGKSIRGWLWYPILGKIINTINS